MIPSFARKAKNSPPDIDGWLNIESETYLFKLKKMDSRRWTPRFDRQRVGAQGRQNGVRVYRVLCASRFLAAEHPALAGFTYDPEFMTNTFFLQALNEVVPDEGHSDSSHPATGDHGTDKPRTRRHSPPRLVGMDRAPEVERPFDSRFPRPDPAASDSMARLSRT